MCSIENGTFNPCGREGCKTMALVPLAGQMVANTMRQEEDLMVRVMVNNDTLQVFVTTPNGMQEVFAIERKMGLYAVKPVGTFFLNSRVAATLGNALMMFLTGQI